MQQPNHPGHRPPVAFARLSGVISYWRGRRALAVRAAALALILLGATFMSPLAREADAVADSAPEEPCDCVSPWREYTRAATPEVEQLFKAARHADEAAFARLIEQVPEVHEYAVDDQPLLAALLRPVAGLGTDRPDRKVRWEQTPEEQQRLRAAHAATLPAKTRMLALALEHGASVKDLAESSRRPPLHLALVFGTPEMVRMLLAHGADPNQLDSDDGRTPIEFALEDEYFMRMSYMPYLVDAPQRTEMILALLAAGAQRPYRQIDDSPERENERPAADYLLWPALAELTRGAEVMEAMSKTGTTPAVEGTDAPHSPLAHAARAGNLGGVQWLKAHLPRVVSDGDPYGLGEKQIDLWLDAASWALYPTPDEPEAASQLDEILASLLVADMPWGQLNEMRDDGANQRLRRTDQPQPASGQTLLHHLVFSGREEWVKKVVQLGAPVDGVRAESEPLPTTPLLQAVIAGDSRMARQLLALAADPLAGPGREYSPLYQAISADSRYRDGSDPADAAQRQAARLEILAALLAELSPQQKAALGEGGLSPLEHALSPYRPAHPDIVRMLMAAGLPAAGLDARALVDAIRSGDDTLITGLLDHGARVREVAGEDGRDASPSLLVAALRWHRHDLLPRLLKVGANPNYREPGEPSAVEWAISNGDNAALDLLLANGGRVEIARPGPEAVTTLDLAVSSGDKAMLGRIAPLWNGDLSQACLPDPSLLSLTVLYSPEGYWETLMAQGFAKAAGAPACVGLAPMAERLVLDMFDDPADLFVGWRGPRFAGRLKELWLPGDARLTPARATELLATARTAQRDDIVQALQQVGARDVPPVRLVAPQPADKPTSQDKALRKALAGHYYLQDVNEVGSEILLKANGDFEYMLAYGATDELAQGTWTVQGGQVIFRTPSPELDPKWAPYKLVAGPKSSNAEPDAVSVRVLYQQRSIPDISVLAVGCRFPQMNNGRTEDDGWTGPVNGSVCQIVLHHPRINEGRAFVHEVAPGAEQTRHFVFEASTPQRQDTEFNVEMSVEDGELVWLRSGRPLRYARE